MRRVTDDPGPPSRTRTLRSVTSVVLHCGSKSKTLLAGPKPSIPIRYDDTIKIYRETNGLSAFWPHLALLSGRSSVLPVAALRHPRGGCLSSCPHRPLAEH